MDPTIMSLLQMYQDSHHGQMYPGISQGGMFGGQPQPAQGQLPPATPDPTAQHHHGFNPLMLLSPFGGLMASNPRLGMSMMSPLMGLMGAFK